MRWPRGTGILMTSGRAGHLDAAHGPRAPALHREEAGEGVLAAGVKAAKAESHRALPGRDSPQVRDAAVDRDGGFVRAAGSRNSSRTPTGRRGCSRTVFGSSAAACAAARCTSTPPREMSRMVAAYARPSPAMSRAGSSTSMRAATRRSARRGNGPVGLIARRRAVTGMTSAASPGGRAFQQSGRSAGQGNARGCARAGIVLSFAVPDHRHPDPRHAGHATAVARIGLPGHAQAGGRHAAGEPRLPLQPELRALSRERRALPHRDDGSRHGGSAARGRRAPWHRDARSDRRRARAEPAFPLPREPGPDARDCA